VNGEEVSWEKSNFENLSMILAINKLTQIENNIRLADQQVRE
jgi:hypothetical protein